MTPLLALRTPTFSPSPQISEAYKSRPSWLRLSQSYLLPNNTTLFAHFLRNQKQDLICLVKAKCGMYAMCVDVFMPSQNHKERKQQIRQRERLVREKDTADEWTDRVRQTERESWRAVYSATFPGDGLLAGK